MTTRLTGEGIETPLLNGKAPEEGKAVSWASLNGIGVIAVRNSLNIASVTDFGTGQVEFHCAATMADADYHASSGLYGWNGFLAFPTTTSIKVYCGNVSHSYTDANPVWMQTMGALA
ncbi:MAG: hypothetical protein JKY49_18295 [Cohaesibacteraceae bacterium]|nr:hypothetical protein [Cohaesibacteraceae bacterium]